MNYTLNTTKSEKYNILTVGKEWFYLFNKKAVAGVELSGNTLTITYADGTAENKAYQYKPTKGGSRVVDNRHRNWRRRG
jgi:hypothetical protein